VKKISKPICIVICEHYLGELQSVIEIEKLQDIVPKTIPSCELHVREGWEDIIDNIGQLEKEYHIILFGGSCIVGLGDLPKELVNVDYYRIECRGLFVNKSLLKKFVTPGVYLATPGWLKNWTENIKVYGIDDKTIKKSFKKTVTKIVLLDTEIYDDSLQKLKEFSDYIGLAHEILPVGLDFFTMYVKKVLLEHEINHALEKGKNEELERAMKFLGIESAPSINGKEVQHVCIFLTIWDDKVGPQLVKYHPKELPMQMEPDEISFQLFRAVESIYGKEKIKHAKGFLLEIDNIDMQGYVFFDKIDDPNARGNERQFMLAAIAPKINYFESIKIAEIFKIMSSKIKEEIDWNIINYWEKVTNVLTNPVI